MTTKIDAKAARRELSGLPDGTSYREAPTPEQVYFSPSNRKAMDLDIVLVTGMRGAGKTFWWNALQNQNVRRLVGRIDGRSALTGSTQVRAGFGILSAPDDYPGKDVLMSLLSVGVQPRSIWRAVQAHQLADGDHPLGERKSWRERATYVQEQPDAIARLFHDRDMEFEAKGIHFLLLFDALDRCSDDWAVMYRLIRGLLRHAVDMHSYRRLRVKVFLRSDQVNESRIADFPGASKVLSSAVQLNWPRRELYGLLWHHLANAPNGGAYRKFLWNEQWDSTTVDRKTLFAVPRRLVNDEELQRRRFHVIAGPRMGRGRRRGFPYTWIPDHLGDTERKVSPRSFLAALRTAAEDAAERYPDHHYALHYSSINRGVQKASQIRVRELREDYPWVDSVLKPLAGMYVPCDFRSISQCWRNGGVLDLLQEQATQDAEKLPPRRPDRGVRGIRENLESLHVFHSMSDGRINIPEVFRVGYGLGRSGGVKPVR